MKKLVIVTTVPETLLTILAGQPKYLSQYYEVIIVTSPGYEMKLAEAEGVRVISVPMERGISISKDLVSIWKLFFILRDLKPDAVHSYTPKAGLVSTVASFLSRVRIRLHTFTGLIFPTEIGFKKQLLINVDRLICFCATHVVPEGEGVKSDLSNYKVTSKRLTVIGNGNIAGVNTDYFKDTKDKISGCLFYKEIFTFVYVGRLNADKGVDELISAFTKLDEDNTRLIIVGGEDYTKPISTISRSIITNSSNIKNIGFVDDIRPYLSSADCLVLPSYREGFPNVVLQAGSMGLPCIVTDVNGSNEIITDGVNGWIVPPKDIMALKNAMEEAKIDNNIIVKGQNARENVVRHYEKYFYLNALTEYYESVFSEMKGQ